MFGSLHGPLGPRRTLAALAAATALGAALPAPAQQPDSVPVRTLEGLVVTATRTATARVTEP